MLFIDTIYNNKVIQVIHKTIICNNFIDNTHIYYITRNINIYVMISISLMITMY